MALPRPTLCPLCQGKHSLSQCPYWKLPKVREEVR